MPNSIHYRKLAREYALKAQRAHDALFAEGYQRLAVGYENLAEGFAVLVKAHRFVADSLPEYSQSIGEPDKSHNSIEPDG